MVSTQLSESEKVCKELKDSNEILHDKINEQKHKIEKYEKEILEVKNQQQQQQQEEEKETETQVPSFAMKNETVSNSILEIRISFSNSPV